MDSYKFDPEPIKILLVEDSLEASNLIKGMLHDIGVTQILTAKNGVEALDLLGVVDGDDLVNTILCDWNMPRLTGLELLKQVRTCDREIPFLMITGLADKASVSEAKTYGVTAYIRKPFSHDELKAKLHLVSRILSHRAKESA